MLFDDPGDDGGVGSGIEFSPRFKGEMGGEWIGVVNGIIASRLSGGGKKLLNRPNPGEKIELQAKSSGSCINGELVLTELARLFRSEFVLSFQEGVTWVRDLPMMFVSFGCFEFLCLCRNKAKCQ